MLILMQCYFGMEVLALYIGPNDITIRIVSIIHVWNPHCRYSHGIKENDTSPILEQTSHSSMLKHPPINSSQKHFSAVKGGAYTWVQDKRNSI